MNFSPAKAGNPVEAGQFTNFQTKIQHFGLQRSILGVLAEVRPLQTPVFLPLPASTLAKNLILLNLDKILN